MKCKDGSCVVESKRPTVTLMELHYYAEMVASFKFDLQSGGGTNLA